MRSRLDGQRTRACFKYASLKTGVARLLSNPLLVPGDGPRRCTSKDFQLTLEGSVRSKIEKLEKWATSDPGVAALREWGVAPWTAADSYTSYNTAAILNEHGPSAVGSKRSAKSAAS